MIKATFSLGCGCWKLCHVSELKENNEGENVSCVNSLYFVPESGHGSRSLSRKPLPGGFQGVPRPVKRHKPCFHQNVFMSILKRLMERLKFNKTSSILQISFYVCLRWFLNFLKRTNWLTNVYLISCFPRHRLPKYSQTSKRIVFFFSLCHRTACNITNASCWLPAVLGPMAKKIYIGPPCAAAVMMSLESKALFTLLVLMFNSK